MHPNRISKEEFILRSRKKHGDKYNYDKVEYKSIHGEFEQTPYAHLRWQGCP